VPVVMAAGLWRVTAGMIAAALAWVGASVLLVGFSGIHDWIAVLLSTQVGEIAKTVGLPALAGGAAGLGVAAVAAAVGMAGAWRCRETLRREPEIAVALGLALSLICSPHVYAGDLLLLAIP